MKKIKNCVQLKIPKVVKKTLAFVLFLMVFDVLLAGFGSTYLSETTVFFFHKSMVSVLSDLLFVEGAITFCMGAFIEFAQSFTYRSPSDELGNEQTTNLKKLREQLAHPGTLMMIIGAGFIGLSIIFSKLVA